MRLASVCMIMTFCIASGPTLDSVAYHIAGAVVEGDYTIATGKAAIRGIYREASGVDRDEIQGVYTAPPFYGELHELEP